MYVGLLKSCFKYENSLEVPGSNLKEKNQEYVFL